MILKTLRSKVSPLKRALKASTDAKRTQVLAQKLQSTSIDKDALESTIENALSYTKSLKFRNLNGRYLYKRSGKKPILYASVFAALTRHLLGDLENASREEIEEWGYYINQHQGEDGLYRDPLVANEIAETEDWWGWRHLTLLSLMALTALNQKPKYPLDFITKIATPSQASQFLENLDWGNRVSFTSNTLQNYVAVMQYARDFMSETRLAGVINELLNGITKYCNPTTGLWGCDYSDEKTALSDGVQAGYHFWLLYWYDNLEIPFPIPAFQSIIQLQNKYGGFNLQKNFSSACEDIDALHPLVKISQVYPQCHDQAVLAIERSLPWIVSNFNMDGGAVFQRHSSFLYGHFLMFSKAHESTIFATWFRLLSLAYCSVLTPNYFSRFFHFIKCPGLQYPVDL
jgi:hypothetical protein